MKIKQCTKCKERKPLSEFYKNPTGKGSVRGDCKKCVKFYQRTRKVDRVEQKEKHRKTFRGILQSRLSAMRQRCNNSKNAAYKYYGGRGIKCLFRSGQELIDYVINELKIDPHGLDIDRIDNNGHYEPGNIRLVTHKENCNNRTKIRKGPR